MTTFDNVTMILKSVEQHQKQQQQQQSNTMDEKPGKNYTCPCSEVFYESLKFIEHAKSCQIFDMAANNFLKKPIQHQPEQPDFTQNRDGNLKCLECSQSLTNEFQLIQHCHTEHNKLGTYMCEPCHESFGNLAKYIVHRMLNPQCCTNRSSKASSVNSGDGLKCGLCQKTGFRQHSELLYHLNTCSVNGQMSSSSSSSISAFDPKGQELLNRASMILSQHGKKSEGGNNNSHGNTNNNNDPSTITDASRPFRCEHCVKSFKSKALLDQHMHIHFPPKYTCRYCSKKYRWPPVFYHHQRTCKKRLQPPNNGQTTSSQVNIARENLQAHHHHLKGASDTRSRRNRNTDGNNAPNMLLQQLQSQGIIPTPGQVPPSSHLPPGQLNPPQHGKMPNHFESLLKAMPQTQQSNLMNILLTATTLGMKFPSFLSQNSSTDFPMPQGGNLFSNLMNNSPFGKQKMSQEVSFPTDERPRKICSNCKVSFDDLSSFLIHITTCRPSFKTNESPASNELPQNNPFISMINSLNRQMSNQHSPMEETSLPSNFHINPAQFLNQIEENRRLLEAQSTNNSSSSSCGDPLSKTPPKTPEFVDDDYFDSLQPICNNSDVIQCQFCGKDFAARSKMKQHFEEVHAIVYRHKCDNCNKRFRWGPSYSYHMKVCLDQNSSSSSRPFQQTPPQNMNNSSKFMADSLANYEFDSRLHQTGKDESSSDPEHDHNSTSYIDDCEFDSPMKKTNLL